MNDKSKRFVGFRVIDSGGRKFRPEGVLCGRVDLTASLQPEPLH